MDLSIAQPLYSPTVILATNKPRCSSNSPHNSSTQICLLNPQTTSCVSDLFLQRTSSLEGVCRAANIFQAEFDHFICGKIFFFLKRSRVCSLYITSSLHGHNVEKMQMKKETGIFF